MRIGEILIKLSIIDTKKLDDALTYASYKTIPLGRALRVLRYITEEDLTRALDAQMAIRNGLDSATGLAALRYAVANKKTFVDAVQLPHTVLGLTTQVSQNQILLATNKTQAAPAQKFALPKREVHTFEELVELGDGLFLSNQIESAEKAYINAYNLVEDVHGVPPSKVATILTKLAHLYFSIDRFKEAQPIYERVLEIHRKVFGNDSPEVTRALEDLGDLYDIQDKFSEARRFFEQALASMHNQKNLELDAAGRLLKKVLSIAKRTNEQGPRSRLGELAVDSGLLAQDKLQAALQTSRDTGKPLGAVLRDENLLDTQQVESLMFAQMLVKQGTVPTSVAVKAIKLASAQHIPLRHLCEVGKWIGERELNDEQRMQLVLEQEKLLSAEAAFGADSEEVASIVQRVADLHLARKDRVSAEMMYKRALSILQKLPNVDHSIVADSFERLAQVHREHGKYAEAQPLLLKALEHRQKAGKSETIEAAYCLWCVAKVELAQFNHATALSFLRSARALYDKLQPGQCPQELIQEMTTCCLETGITADLEPLLVNLITAAKSQNKQFDPETARFMEQLGDVYLNSGRHAHAQAQYYAAMQIYERTPGSETKAQAVSKKLAQATKV